MVKHSTADKSFNSQNTYKVRCFHYLSIKFLLTFASSAIYGIDDQILIEKFLMRLKKH